ncbi:MAG: sulfite exporter TauE/SafE family protein [Bacteroidota bacterium]
MEKYIYFFLLAFVAEVIGTISGFGSSILFVPLASMFFDFKAVLAITAVFHVFSNLSKIYLFRTGIQKDIVLKLGVPAVIFVIIGALLTNIIPQKEIELWMNFVLILLSVFLIFNSDKKLEQSDKNLIVGGISSGFLAGLVGTGGAIRGLVLAAFSLEKDSFLATSALIDLGVDFSRAIVYVSSGYFLKEFLIFIPFLILISIAGSYTGKLVLNKIPQKYFRYVVLIVIISISFYSISRYF